MSLFFQSAGGVHLVGWYHFLSRLIPLLEPADSTSWVGCTDILPDCIKNIWGFLPFSSHYLPIILPSSSHHPPIILPTSSQLSYQTIPKESRKNPEGCDEKGRDMVLLCDILWSVVQRDMVVRFQGDKNLQLKGCLVVCPCTCERAWTNWAAPFLLNGFRMVLERE